MTARTTLGEGDRPAPFRLPRGGFLVSPWSTFPPSPPLIPDGRISRVRLAATAISQHPFPCIVRLKRSPAYPRPTSGYQCRFATRSPVTQNPGFASGCVAARQPLPTESPFAPSRCYRSSPRLMAWVGRRYPAFIALTGSCARPPSSRRFRLSLFLRVLAGCCESLLHDGPSRRYLCYLPAGAWTPTPAALQVHLPVSSLKALAFPAAISGRRFRPLPAQRLQCGSSFRGCSHSVMFRPPRLLAILVAPTVALSRSAAMAFTSGHPVIRYLLTSRIC